MAPKEAGTGLWILLSDPFQGFDDPGGLFSILSQDVDARGFAPWGGLHRRPDATPAERDLHGDTLQMRSRIDRSGFWELSLREWIVWRVIVS